MQVQCPPRTCCKKTWVSEVKQQTITCVRYERECVRKQVPCTSVRYVSERQSRGPAPTRPARWCRSKVSANVTYTSCRMVPETVHKTCTYRVCHMVPETVNKVVTVPRLPHGAGDGA